MLGIQQRFSHSISKISTYIHSYVWIKKTIFKMFSWVSVVVFFTLSVLEDNPAHHTLTLSQAMELFSSPWFLKANWTGIIAVLWRGIFEISKSEWVNFVFPKQMLSAYKDRIYIHLFFTFYCYAIRFWNNLSFEFHLIALQTQCVIVPSPLSWHKNAFSITVHIPAFLGRFSQVLQLLQFNEHVPEKQIKSSCFFLFVSFVSFLKNTWFLFRCLCISIQGGAGSLGEKEH